jgi:hypothetical protein
MGNEIGHFEHFAATQLVDECVNGFLAQLLVGRSKVDEIGVVSHYHSDTAFAACPFEGLDLFRRERLSRPLAG